MKNKFKGKFAKVALGAGKKIFHDDFILNKTHKPNRNFHYNHLYGFRKNNSKLNCPDLSADLTKVIDSSTAMKDGIPILNVKFIVFVFYYF